VEVDEQWMRRAQDLALQALGRTSPNPLVGAVLVRDEACVGEGFHARAGEPHAEVVALRHAGAAAMGATLYVTLEPCSHTGRTPPCVGAVVAAGVRRVVSAMEDPDPRVRGRGHAELRRSGVELAVGVGESAARRANAEFVHRVTTGRAFGVLKAAITLDGRLAADGGDARWITGAPARRRAHELRDRYDAVMIGRGTLEADDPELDVRLPGDRRDPWAVVLDAEARSSSSRRLFARAEKGARVLVATTDRASGDNVERLRRTGAEVAVLERDGSLVDLDDVLRVLAERGCNSVMMEGGQQVHTTALRRDLVRRAHLFVAPKILGGADGPRLVGDLGIGRVQDAIRLEDVEHEALGEDWLVTGLVAPRSGS
jgi:diaminohydroxyphosphoribosylaminopyrimidine deaminase/5-amino-6-(5-phosphoribosylamino)uracil reductase